MNNPFIRKSRLFLSVLVLIFLLLPSSNAMFDSTEKTGFDNYKDNKNIRTNTDKNNLDFLMNGLFILNHI
jgi:hypothetical protein